MSHCFKYYDEYTQANHFDLLLPQRNCCNAPPPESRLSTVKIDLLMLSNVSAVKRNSKKSLPTKVSSSTTTNTVKHSPQTQLPKQTKGTPLGKDSATKTI